MAFENGESPKEVSGQAPESLSVPDNANSFDFDAAFDEAMKGESIGKKAPDDEPEVTEEDGEEDEEEGSDEDGEEDEDADEDGDEDEDDEDDEEDDEESDTGLKKALEDAKKGSFPPSKKILNALTPDGKKIKIPDATVVEFKRKDGTQEAISIQELRRGYIGSSENLANATKVKQEKGAFEAQRSEFDGVLQSWKGRAESGEGVAVLGEMFQRFGINPLPAIRGIRNYLVDNAKEYFQLTPEQRKYLEAQEDAEYSKYLLAQVQRDQLTQKQREAQEAKKRDIVRQYDIPSVEAFDSLEAEVRHMIETGQLPKDTTVTPEGVGTFYQARKVADLVLEVVDEVNPKLRDDKATLNDLFLAVQAHKPSKKELRAVIREAYGSGVDRATRNLNERVQKNKIPVSSLASQSSRSKLRKKSNDPGLNWDKI